jgi:hypothetical protein
VPLILLGIVFYLRDGRQTVKVEIDPALVKDASVTVWLDGKEMEVAGLGETIRLKPGPHGYEIRRGDQIIQTRAFTVAKGENPVLKVSVGEATVLAKPTAAPIVSQNTANHELAFDSATSSFGGMEPRRQTTGCRKCRRRHPKMGSGRYREVDSYGTYAIGTRTGMEPRWDGDAVGKQRWGAPDRAG